MPQVLAPGIVLFERRAPDNFVDLANAVLRQAPPVAYATPMGGTMSARISNCGPWGWVSDRTGYRYSPVEPATGCSWPPLPAPIAQLASTAAAEAGFIGFAPDACLINLYGPDARMGVHQDRDEDCFDQPIVSMSFGRNARFRYGGMRRRDATASIILRHGDVLVFGGPARLMFHGIDRLLGPAHPVLGDGRINLTLRRARRIG